MSETLFLLLGTGQNILQDLDKREYKTTTYYLASDKFKRAIESPFVGEAIIKLNPGRFSEVHIFGTSSSMWETLYMYAIDKMNDPNDLHKASKYFPKLWKAVSDKSLVDHLDLLQEINNTLSKYFSIPTSCHIIDLGETEEQLWKVFDEILNLKFVDKITISFDITHGLRYQPFFLMFSLFYLHLMSDKKIKFGSIFYGALELKNEEKHKNMAPIFEFKIFSELHNWITAAEVFHRYKDPEQFVNLIKENPDTKKLSEIIDNYSFAFNSNNFHKIIRESKLLVEEIDNIEKMPNPLKYVIPKIKEFPKEIQEAKKEAQKLLLIARILLKQHNYGSSILALYEAVVETYRVQKKIENKFQAHQQFSQDLDKLKHKVISNQIKDFYPRLQELKNIRNAIAHLNDSNRNIITIESIRDLINYFSGNLEKAIFS